ncbi:T9SS type A sorting domain-containing protein [Chryseobacterium populi]|uniref:Por secretion system C-terminal sorting domain containing protein n=1 Tax=Chryseobacterium populi TaxID=1144316 RepID=J3CGA6_9FLAO|nr:T9SS type A sorting domain-containing protein [Chryseobacterium populi]EJL70821.1 Por secretion system C-terminal sorting domain containing protein [Chryseobacterium populi]
MKTKLILLMFLAFTALNINAQCPFTPTITSPRLGAMFPDKVVFCNTESEVLSTQTYDSYQWYKQEWDWQTPNTNPWVAIPGATSQTLTIDGTNDMLYYFKVEVTQANCTAQSAEIMSDGYAYGLPAMMTTFTPGTYEQVGAGEYNICEGASVKFENIYPVVYGNHTWYKCTPGNIPPVPGDPCIISGATGDSYTATETGFYGFYACTEYCPDQCEFLGLGGFQQLNFGNWSFCGLGTDETKPKSNDLTLYPNPATQLIYIGKASDKTYKEISIVDASGRLMIQKTNHQYNQPIDVSALTPGAYIIASKSAEGKVYRNKFIKK